MRFVACVAVALLLAGCTSEEWARATSFNAPSADYPPAAEPVAVHVPAPPVPAASVPAASIPAAVQANCARAARERAEGAADQDFGEDVQAQVYNATYADCMHFASPGSAR